jgi:hypothetical protein
MPSQATYIAKAIKKATGKAQATRMIRRIATLADMSCC